MPVCVFDNPATMARECWQNGRLLCSYYSGLFLRKRAPGETQPIPPELFFFGANVGPWTSGRLIGDPNAMRAEGATIERAQSCSTPTT